MAKRRPQKFDDDDVRKLVGEGRLVADPFSPNLFIRLGRRSKTFTTVVRQPGGKQVWTKIGQHPQMSIVDARVEAARIIERIRAGQSLKEASSPAAVTLAHVVEDYKLKVGRHQRQWHSKRVRIAKWLLPEFGKIPFLDIQRSQVNALLDEIEKASQQRTRPDGARPATTDQILVDLQALEKHFLSMPSVPDDYKMRFRGGLVPKRSKPSARERVLEHDELRAIWAVAGEAGRFGVIIKLCLYSAQRIMKILSMRWDHLNLDTGEWKIPRAAGEKGVPKVLTLPPAAIMLIKTQPRLTPYVFPSRVGTGHLIGLSELKREFAAQLPKMDRWGMHDLRRTSRTLMTQVKRKIRVRDGTGEEVDEEIRAIDSEVAEAILGHKIRGVRGVYDRHEHTLEMKVALARLADHIKTIVGENVVSLVQAG